MEEMRPGSVKLSGFLKQPDQLALGSNMLLHKSPEQHKQTAEESEMASNLGIADQLRQRQAEREANLVRKWWRQEVTTNELLRLFANAETFTTDSDSADDRTPFTQVRTDYWISYWELCLTVAVFVSGQISPDVM